jgi:hypothetical protein
VDPRAGLDNMEKRNPWPCQNLNSDPLVIQPVGSCYTDYTAQHTKHKVLVC